MYDTKPSITNPNTVYLHYDQIILYKTRKILMAIEESEIAFAFPKICCSRDAEAIRELRREIKDGREIGRLDNEGSVHRGGELLRRARNRRTTQGNAACRAASSIT